MQGLLIGLAGVAAGLATFLLTGRLSFGLVILATVWLAFGWRRRVDPTTGAKGPFPSLFFIPLGVLGFPILALALPVYFIEQVAARQQRQPSDPRMALLDADEQLLRSARLSGDLALSRAIAETLQSTVIAEAKAEDFRVFTRKSNGAILVLIAAPNLKEFKDRAREQLLNFVEGILIAEDDANRDYYIGVKGRVAFGAVRVPPHRTEIGSIVSETLLYPFYDERTTSRPAATAGAGATRPTPTSPAPGTSGDHVEDPAR